MRSDYQFIEKATDRQKRRRKEDRDKSPTGRSDVGYRGMAVCCYAYPSDGRAPFVGYSGSASGMRTENILSYKFTSGHVESRETLYRQEDRRRDRFESALSGGSDRRSYDSFRRSRPLDRPLCNCAEAAALSLAYAAGYDLNELTFVAFSDGQTPMNPCRNCMSWIHQSRGYYSNGRIQGDF